MPLARLSFLAGAAALICSCAAVSPPTPTPAVVVTIVSPGSGATRPAAAGSAGPACPFATRADAAAALGKDSMEGQAEGDDKCFFAAADTRSGPATEYVDVAVTRHGSEADARILFDATGGRPGSEKLSGLGDAAVFVKDADGGQLLVLKGKTTVLTGVQSKAQADPRGALQTLSQAVLAKV
jgi:hypothetical protein